MKIINWTVYAIAKFNLFLCRFIPMGITFAVSRAVGALAYRLLRNRRELMLYNLDHAFGESMSASEKERIARESMINLCLSFGELLCMDAMYPKWEKHFEIVGGEHVDKCIEEGKGFFVFGGHFGGWTSMGSVLYRFPKCPGFNMVARPLRNPYMQELLDFLADKFGGRIVTTSGTGKLIVERAERGELIGLYMDQESRSKQGIFVNFFGREASSHVVPGYLAWKYDIPLIPYWIIRTKPGHFRVVFKKPLEYEITADADENNRVVTQLIANEVESTIRQYPEQWLWAHNRWKRRPDGTREARFQKKSHRVLSDRQERVTSRDLANK